MPPDLGNAIHTCRNSVSRGHARTVRDIFPTSSPRFGPPAAVPPPHINGTWFNSVARPPVPKSPIGITARAIIPALTMGKRKCQ